MQAIGLIYGEKNPRRFGGNKTSTIFERLAAVRQIGSMEDFIQEFEILVSRANQTSKD